MRNWSVEFHPVAETLWSIYIVKIGNFRISLLLTCWKIHNKNKLTNDDIKRRNKNSFNLKCKREKVIFTAHKRSLGQGNIFRSVCQEFCSQGGEYLGRYPRDQEHSPQDQVHSPQDQVHPQPPRPGTPPGTRYTHGPSTPPQDQVPTPSCAHAGIYGQQAGGMHPTGMLSCFGMRFIPVDPRPYSIQPFSRTKENSQSNYSSLHYVSLEFILPW